MGSSFVTILAADALRPATRGRWPTEAAPDSHEDLAVLRRVIEDADGRTLTSDADGVLAAFGSAVAAVRCAVALQRASDAAGGPALRIGLDAGERALDADVAAGPLDVARRLCDAAAPGEILASDVVRQLAEAHEPVAHASRGTMRLSGRAARIGVSEIAWRLRGAAEPTPALPERAITVVIADDMQLLRGGFRAILEAETDITVVGEAPDGRIAVDMALRRQPDVVLMDIRMPALDGLEAARRILSAPEVHTAVLMLTSHDDNQYVYEALRIGASGFLVKDGPPERLVDAVRVAASGDALLSPSITRRLITRFATAARPPVDGVPERLAELTDRELEVLRLIARGLSNGEIAAELVLGENTVKTHVARILSKLGLRDRVQAVVVAYETGFVASDA